MQPNQPSNAIIGDAQPIQLPQMPDDQHEEALLELRKKAKYSRSKEFAEIRERVEAKIVYYQCFLPGGIPPENIPEEERGKYWGLANLLIKELREIIDPYTDAEELLKE